MITAVASSVLLDVLAGTPEAARLAAERLALCAAEGRVIVCEMVIAEVTPEAGADRMEDFLRDWHLEFVASSTASAVLAGCMHADYLRRGGKRGRVVPDFIIGAHAITHADRLLTRDAGFARDYFGDLATLAP
jgi:predicted nucleic acid-binding protein